MTADDVIRILRERLVLEGQSRLVIRSTPSEARQLFAVIHGIGRGEPEPTFTPEASA